MIAKVIIETPKGSKKKYEMTTSGKLRFDKNLSPGFVFPGNYGFFPETISGDKDALDVLVLGRKAKKRAKMEIRPIAIIKMIDEGEKDDKIIAVSARSTKKKLTKKEIDKIRYFFKCYKQRKIKIKGFEGVEKAKKAILQAKKRYRG